MPDFYMYIDSRVFIFQVFSPYSVVALAEFLFAAVQLALGPTGLNALFEMYV